MEQPRVRVRSVEVLPEGHLAVARVSATSARKVRGRPVARIELKVAVEVRRDEPEASLRSRLRDEALAFLDVADAQ
jgi:hypothetical protein